MKKKFSRLGITLALLIIFVPASVQSHHSFDMFDKQSEMWIEGTIKVLQWTNPHAFIQVVVDENGKTIEWSLEGGSPNILRRNGWTRTSVKPGEKVRVLIYPLRNGDPGGSFLEVHKEDGSVYYYHG